MELLITLLFWPLRAQGSWRVVCCVSAGFFGALHAHPKLQAFFSYFA